MKKGYQMSNYNSGIPIAPIKERTIPSRIKDKIRRQLRDKYSNTQLPTKEMEKSFEKGYHSTREQIKKFVDTKKKQMEQDKKDFEQLILHQGKK